LGKKAAREIASANSVVLATYIMDLPATCTALQKTTEKQDASCLIIVDRGEHENKSLKGQQRALTALQGAGAEVLLCYGRQGRARSGAMHIKCLAVDKRIAYWGGANTTKNSMQSWELMTRATGPQVQDMLRYCLALRRKKGSILMPS
jgi:phosphatidylserine/phosphatidylglycerophosphate/cardiolipin synthase-like enzyme